jgi:DNA-binding beta-propeller fold protein YncE
LGRFAYLWGNSNAIVTYTIQSTGVLTTSSVIFTYTSPSQSPFGILPDPTGRFLYTFESTRLQTYSINQSTGVLTNIGYADNPLSAGSSGAALDPTGRFLYATYTGGLQTFLVNPATGTMTSSTNVSTGASTNSPTIDPTGNYLYLWTALGSTVYSINQYTGKLTTATSLSAPVNTASMVIDPRGRFLYAANGNNGGTIFQHNISNFAVGNGSFSGNATVGGGIYVGGTATLTNSTEPLNTKSGATGVVVHDYTTGGTWYHSSIAANFTANFTNVPTTDSRSIVFNLVLVQGSTAYIPSALQIDGSAQTIKWANGVTPSGNPNKVDIATFTLIRTGAAWAQALGTYSSFG